MEDVRCGEYHGAQVDYNHYRMYVLCKLEGREIHIQYHDHLIHRQTLGFRK